MVCGHLNTANANNRERAVVVRSYFFRGKVYNTLSFLTKLIYKYLGRWADLIKYKPPFANISAMKFMANALHEQQPLW